MRNDILFLSLLAIGSVVAVRPAAADNVAPDALVFSGDQDALFGPALMQTDAPDLAALPQRPAPSTGASPARFDPANMRLFGAELGGEGVQGGAVLSLSWPTQR